jgi:hypothetical protein
MGERKRGTTNQKGEEEKKKKKKKPKEFRDAAHLGARWALSISFP